MKTLEKLLIKEKKLNGNSLKSGRKAMKKNFTQIPNFLIDSLLVLDELKSLKARNLFDYIIRKQMGYLNVTEIELNFKKIEKETSIKRTAIYKSIDILLKLGMIIVIEKNDKKYLRGVWNPENWNIKNKAIDDIIKRAIESLTGKKTEDEQEDLEDDSIDDIDEVIDTEEQADIEPEIPEEEQLEDDNQYQEFESKIDIEEDLIDDNEFTKLTEDDKKEEIDRTQKVIKLYQQKKKNETFTEEDLDDPILSMLADI